MLDQQKAVNQVLKTCRSYNDMIAPYGDAYLLNRTVRKYMRVYINPTIPLKCPGINQVFTFTRLDRLCTDTTQHLQRFWAVGKPSYTFHGLMYGTQELYEEQQRIINKYTADYNWKNLLPEVDLTLHPSEKERRPIEI